MDLKSASTIIPFLRSCDEESSEPLEGEIKGEIPKWLKGSLLRVGSGLLRIGPHPYNHLFDGMALIHRFSFQDGKVTYQNKFLRSDRYCENIRENRIVSSEFGTIGVPDPCKTIFQRFASVFHKEKEKPTDNDLVNIILYGGEAYASSESNYIWKINPETLESLEKVNLRRFVPVTAAVAHAHEDTDGTVYNLGSTFTSQPNYKILKFPPKGESSTSTFQNASVVCSIQGSKYLNVSYHHSFGMSENYFIFVEQPLYMSITKMTWSYYVSGAAFSDCMSWDENRPCRFHVVRRSDGTILDTVYVAESFFVFHHINAYEENDQLVVDLCAYPKGNFIKELYIKAIEQYFKNNPNNPHAMLSSQAMRYVLPLSIQDMKEVTKDENLVKLTNTTATAKLREDGSIFCSPETLSNEWTSELPRINYEKFNGKKYKYYYSIGTHEKRRENQLIKGNAETKEIISWCETETYPSEPVFISHPDANDKDEDSGVLLASLLYENDESKVSLLVLNAKTMKEIGRVNFLAKSSIPATFHGAFVKRP